MFTVPVWIFLKMTDLQRHEELLEAGLVCQFDDSMGRALFVSHQWLGTHHPDPCFEQLRVLQKTLMDLISGACRVSLPAVVELWFGRLRLPTARDFNGQGIFLWYDYFSVPQCEKSIQPRQMAISSIPSYISQSFFFVILIPAVQHEDGGILSLETWAERGWCRLESMARSLAREDGFMITVKVASNPTLSTDLGGLGKAPGKGIFTVEEDRSKCGPVLAKLMWSKLHNLLFQGDFHNYRFLLNLQGHCFKGLETDHFESLVPNFATEIDPSTDPHGFIVAKFLHENGFMSVEERDMAGWSPICYAVLKDDPFLIEALVRKKADVNDSNRRAKNEAQLPKGLPLLSLAGTYKSNQAMKALLLAKANVNAKDSFGGNALSASIGMGNAEAVDILCDANIDPRVKLMPGTGPFKVACGFANVQTLQAFMTRLPANVNLRFSLHFGLIFHANIDTVSFLMTASADINEQLEVPMKKTGWWMLLKLLSLRHTVSPSNLTYLAYHHAGATPLMLSIITGKFDCASLLLAAGARVDLKNRRGKTAVDIAKEICAPISLTRPPADETDKVESYESDPLVSVAL